MVSPDRPLNCVNVVLLVLVQNGSARVKMVDGKKSDSLLFIPTTVPLSVRVVCRQMEMRQKLVSDFLPT